jgi:hypothetical protein
MEPEYWEVFWLVSVKCAFPVAQWPVADYLLCETYSSGDCPGFAPGSLFQYYGAKVPDFCGLNKKNSQMSTFMRFYWSFLLCYAVVLRARSSLPKFMLLCQ